jgi:hypothetical protein
MGWFSKASAAVGIAAAITGGGTDKARDNYLKGRSREEKAKTERIMSRRNDAHSSMRK